jgi:hypothetical protein
MKNRYIMCFLIIGCSILAFSYMQSQLLKGGEKKIEKGNEEQSKVFTLKDFEGLAKRDISDVAAEAALGGFKYLLEAFTSDDFKRIVSGYFKSKYTAQYVAEEKAAVQKGVLLADTITPETISYLDVRKTKEGVFLENRVLKAHHALEKFLGITIDAKHETPRIACAFSGGGYRATFLTAGYLKAMEDIGLLGGTLYIAGLSGSTWYLGPWIYQQEPSKDKDKKVTINKFNKELANRIEKLDMSIIEPFGLTKKSKKDKKEDPVNVKSFINNVLWPKLVFGQPLNSADVYGATFIHLFLPEKEKDLTHLSYQWTNVQTGDVPWPIYTAASMHKINGTYSYVWYEFNPEEVRDLEFDFGIPAYAFGRKFENGQSIDAAPEQSFGFQAAIWGSAYTVNLRDIKRIYFGQGETKEERNRRILNIYRKTGDWIADGIGNLKQILINIKAGKLSAAWDLVKGRVRKYKEKATDIIEQLKVSAFITFIENVLDIEIKVSGEARKLGSMRFAPAQIFNPFKNYEEANQEWLRNRDYLTLVDAGIAYNFPLRPLFRPERAIDVLIVGDASENAAEGPLELQLAFKDIERFYGIRYRMLRKADIEKRYGTFIMSDKVMKIYVPEDEYHPTAHERLAHVVPPVIIYFNFLKDENLINSAKRGTDDKLKKLIEEKNLEAFDPAKCLKGYCATLNFRYTPKEFEQLSGIGEFNLKVHEPLIKAVINDRVRYERVDIGG